MSKKEKEKEIKKTGEEKKMSQKVSDEQKELMENMQLLNESGLLEEEVNFDEDASLEDNIESFMEAVESIPTDKEDEIPEGIVNYYNALVDAVEKKAKEAKSKASQKKEQKEKKEKKEKNGKDPAKVARGKALADLARNRDKNEFGHVSGSTRFAMDALLVKGCNKEAVVKMLIKDFGKDEDYAKKRFDKYIAFLKKEGFSVKETGGTFKLSTK